MATIRNSISLTDQMSPTLRKIMKAMDSTLRVMQQVDKQMSGGKQSKAYQRAAKDIESANNALKKFGNYSVLAFSEASTGASRLSTALQNIQTEAKKAADLLSNLGTGMMSRRSSLLNQPITLANMGRGSRLMTSLKAGGYGAAGLALKGMSGLIKVPSMLISGAHRMGTAFLNTFSSINKGATAMWQNLAAGIYVIQKIMQALTGLTSTVDQAISDMARLQLFNYSGTTSSQAYGMVYQAAQRSRSDLTATSQLTSRIAMSGVFGQQKGSLEASARMAETINKALVLSGGSSAENERAVLQLSQGLSSGVLQGDELRSIREQAPYLAQMLAEGLAKVDDKYIGTTIGDLKELGAQGELTSAVVVKAFSAMQDQIDATFDDKAPKTWSQGVTSVANTVQYLMGAMSQMENGPLSDLSEIIWNINAWLNSEEGISFLNAMAVALTIIGTVLSWVVNGILWLVGLITSNAPLLTSMFLVLGAVALAAGISALIGWIAAMWPILLAIVVVAALIKLMMSFGYTVTDVFAAVAGVITWFVGLLWNCLLAIAGFAKGVVAVVEALIYNAGLAMENVGLGIKGFFYGVASAVLDVIADIAEALNKLPFIEFDYSGLIDAADRFAEKHFDYQAQIEENNAAKKDLGDAYLEAYRSMGAFQEGWSEKWYGYGSDFVTNLSDKISDSLTGLDIEKLLGEDDEEKDSPGNIEDMLGKGIPVNGGGIDSVGAINSDVDISDEDIQLLRDMAAREFMLNLQTVTPTANITFGDVRETADAKQILGVIEQMVEEQLATSLVS